MCHATCLHSASCLATPSLPLKTKALDLGPAVYHDLGEVFNKSHTMSLPPHQAYDCVFDLLPGTSPPRGHLYSLSVPSLCYHQVSTHRVMGRQRVSIYVEHKYDWGNCIPICMSHSSRKTRVSSAWISFAISACMTVNEHAR